MWLREYYLGDLYIMAKDIRQTIINAASRAMDIVRQAQGGVAGDASIWNPNLTEATSTNKLAEAAALEILQALEDQNEFRFKVDALDGSLPFASGASTSTVIIAGTCIATGEVEFCAVGEPSKGRLWYAEKGMGTILYPMLYTLDSYVPVKVWNGVWNGVSNEVIKRRNIVYLDLYAGFSRPDVRLLDDAECGQLFKRVFGSTIVVQMLGSNGMHHALVANGGEGATAAITTAMGGPWDVAPVLLVLEAGGFAQAFEVDQKTGVLIERNPLETGTYHFLVTGYSEYVVSKLSGSLTSLRRPKT